MAPIQEEEYRDPIGEFNRRFKMLCEVRDPLVRKVLKTQSDKDVETWLDVQRIRLAEPPNAVTAGLMKALSDSAELLLSAGPDAFVPDACRRLTLEAGALVDAYKAQREEIRRLKVESLSLIEEMVKQTFLSEKYNPSWGAPIKDLVPARVKVGFK